MKKSTYAFLIGDKKVTIEAYSEEDAFRLLGVHYWTTIKTAKTIKLLGIVKI